MARRIETPQGLPPRPETPEFTAFKEKMIEERNELKAKVDEEFNKKVNAAGKALDERALAHLHELRTNQKAAIQNFFEERLAKFERETAKNKQEMNNTLKDFKKRSQGRLASMGIVLEAQGGEQVETQEVENILRAMEEMETFEEQHPQLQEILEKLHQKKSISQSEYEKIVETMDPKSIHAISATGVLLAVMTPTQKYELVQTFMESDKKQDTPQFIEALLTTGQINRMQAEKLLKEAENKGIMVSSHFKENFKNTDYEKLARDNKQRLEAQSRKIHRGRFAGNFMNRLSGKPAIGLAFMGWGIITGGMNMLANYKTGDWKRPLTYLGRVAKNPYVPAAILAGAAGTEIFTGTIKKQAPETGNFIEDLGIGKGAIGEVFTVEDTTTPEALKGKAQSRLEELYLNSPEPLARYLENGGYTTMQNVRKTIMREGLEKKLTLNQLIAEETDPQQKKRLQELDSLMFTAEDEVDRKLTEFSVAANIMEIKSNNAMQQTLKEIRKNNNI